MSGAASGVAPAAARGAHALGAAAVPRRVPIPCRLLRYPIWVATLPPRAWDPMQSVDKSPVGV